MSSSINSKSSSDSGRGSETSIDFSNKENLKGKILQLFEEEENDYLERMRKINNPQADSGRGSLEHSSRDRMAKGRGKKTQARKEGRRPERVGEETDTEEVGETEETDTEEERERMAKAALKSYHN